MSISPLCLCVCLYSSPVIHRNILEEAKRRNELESEKQLRDDAVLALERAKQISCQLVQEETLLSENGMQTILRDAFEDG